jgi:hypothetical protein
MDHGADCRLSQQREHTVLEVAQFCDYNTPIPCPLSSRRSAPTKIIVHPIVCDDDGHEERLAAVAS